MSLPPISMGYAGGGVFLADKRQVGICDERLGLGEVVTMAPVEERSKRSHDHFFAQMEEMWETRPEHLTDAYPTADSFRKRALIATGHCDTNTTVCASNAEALRMLALANALAPESLAIVRGAVVTVYTAHSQSKKAMGKEAFQKSKDDCLGWAAEQLGIDGQGAREGQEPSARAA